MLTIGPDLEVAFDFLSQLYRHTTDEGYINLFHVDRDSGRRVTTWAPLDNLAALGEPLVEQTHRGNVWFGVAPRRAPLDEGRRGGVADCVSIPAFWVDIDVASEVHKLPGLPQSYEEARQLVLSFPLKPSMVVRSGYGLQVWWVLRESMQADEALTMLARWQVTWDRLADEMHLRIDNVSNIDRVMRLPGTYNFKGAEPIKVTFRSADRGV
jgi:putative DNA primase/helicase